MRQQILSAIALATVLLPTVAPAQMQTDGAPAPRASQRVAPARIPGMERRYYVAATCSTSGYPRNCVTVIEITNLTIHPCSVGVEFFHGSFGTLKCTAIINDLPGFRQGTICSKAFADPPASCNSTYNPGLMADSGYAAVYASCSRIAVQATIYHTDAAGTGITGVQDVNLIAHGVPPATRANQGD